MFETYKSTILLLGEIVMQMSEHLECHVSLVHVIL